MSDELPRPAHWVFGDFNGVFGEIMCLSHEDTSKSATGERVALAGGMDVVAFDPEPDEHGNPDALVARGRVEPSPDWLTCKGSRWCLRFDEHGIRHWSELDESERAALLRSRG